MTKLKRLRLSLTLLQQETQRRQRSFLLKIWKRLKTPKENDAFFAEPENLISDGIVWLRCGG